MDAFEHGLDRKHACKVQSCLLSIVCCGSGQSNGYCSGDWDCSTTSSSPLPCPPTPPLPLPAGGHAGGSDHEKTVDASDATCNATLINNLRAAGGPCPEHVHTYGDLRPWEWASPHALHRAHNKVQFFCLTR